MKAKVKTSTKKYRMLTKRNKQERSRHKKIIYKHALSQSNGWYEPGDRTRQFISNIAYWFFFFYPMFGRNTIFKIN